MEYYHGCKQQNEFPGNKMRCTLSNGIYELTCCAAARTKPRLAVIVTARKWSPVPKIIFVLEKKKNRTKIILSRISSYWTNLGFIFTLSCKATDRSDRQSGTTVN